MWCRISSQKTKRNNIKGLIRTTIIFPGRPKASRAAENQGPRKGSWRGLRKGAHFLRKKEKKSKVRGCGSPATARSGVSKAVNGWLLVRNDDVPEHELDLLEVQWR